MNTRSRALLGCDIYPLRCVMIVNQRCTAHHRRDPKKFPRIPNRSSRPSRRGLQICPPISSWGYKSPQHAPAPTYTPTSPASPPPSPQHNVNAHTRPDAVHGANAQRRKNQHRVGGARAPLQSGPHRFDQQRAKGALVPRDQSQWSDPRPRRQYGREEEKHHGIGRDSTVFGGEL
jgi:hypothetical protein